MTICVFMSWADICSSHMRFGNFQIRGTLRLPFQLQNGIQSKVSDTQVGIPLCLPVSFQKQVRWQFKELVVLHIQDLHLCSFKPIW